MKKQICKTCNWRFNGDIEFSVLNKNIPNDVRLAKEYCEDHTFTYGDECNPMWCNECGHLDKYQVIMGENSTENPNFDKKRK